MWTRAMLKERAKAVLKKNYWSAFLVSLIICFVSGTIGGGTGRGNAVVSGSNPIQSLKDVIEGLRSVFDQLDLRFLLFFAAVFIVLFIFVIAFRIFVGYHLEVGGRRYFIRQAGNDADLKNLGYGFNKARYFGIVGSMILRDVYLFLWALIGIVPLVVGVIYAFTFDQDDIIMMVIMAAIMLSWAFFIPYIIKFYSYRMVPYILADNPSLDAKFSIELSKDMTYGQKGRMFVLDLSFAGWYLLGLLALFVGVLFVMPYIDSTFAELYLVLRKRAMDMGLCSYGELLIEKPMKDETVSEIVDGQNVYDNQTQTEYKNGGDDEGTI